MQFSLWIFYYKNNKKYFSGHGHSHGGHTHDRHLNLPTLEQVFSEGDINDNKGNFQVPLPDSKMPSQTETKKECKFETVLIYSKHLIQKFNLTIFSLSLTEKFGNFCLTSTNSGMNQRVILHL